MNVPFDPKWRAQSRWKRVFYARYMKWLEWLGFAVVTAVFGGFIFAFNFRVDDVVKADGVELQFAGADILAEVDAWVGKPLVPNFATVQAGQVILELLPDVPPGSPPLPPIAVKAPESGTFMLTAEGQVKAGDILYRLIDPTKVSLKASVAGDSVAKTSIGQSAILKDLAIGGEAAALRIQSGEYLLVTRSVGSDLNLDGLGELSVKLPNDQELAIKGIKSAELDAQADWKDSAVPGIPTNPDKKEKVTGKVVSAAPKAVVQIGDLPPAWRDALSAQVAKELAQRPLRAADGQSGTLVNLRDFRAVLKLNAEGEAMAGAQRISATKVDRTCDVEIVLDSPPSAIIEALRSGFKVTAKVEVVTGNRPIAFILLKKS